MKRVAFLGGNGHCAARLAPARRALDRLAHAVELVDVRYPGFEGRPRAESLDSFVAAVGQHLDCEEADLVYATGIGGLVALALRARGAARGPLLLQAPVLWGLERRAMPRLLRWGPTRGAARVLFRAPPFQAWFARRHFTRPLEPALRAAFFDGYVRCAAFADLFEWFSPAWLRDLERDLALPGALANVQVWWGARDRVVTPRELEAMPDELRAGWRIRIFPEWGHYPMLDDPEAWVGEVAAS